MLACQEHDKKCVLIKMATGRMPQPVVVCPITFVLEQQPALLTCIMAIQQGRGLVFIGLYPLRGTIRHLLLRDVVARVLWVRGWARQHVTHLLHTGSKHGGYARHRHIFHASVADNTTMLER